MLKTDARTVRLLLTGQDFDGNLERVSAEFRPLVERMAKLPPSARAAAWEGFLAGRDDAESLVRAVADQCPDDPAPDVEPSDDGSAGGWEPISLPTMPPPEPFPVDVLPPPVAHLIRVGAEAIGCSPDFLGMTALVVASGAIGRSVRLRMKPSYFVGASLYAVNIAIASDGKSPAQMLIAEPLRRIEERLWAEYEAELRKREAEMDAALGGDSKGKRSKPPAEPKLRRIDIDDFTMEVVPALLAENPRGLVTVKDELTSFLLGVNQYKGGKGNDRSTILKIWSGEPIKKDRVGHANHIPIAVPHPFLSIVGGIPPDMLHEMAHAKGCSDGFLDRFLFAYPESKPVPKWSEEGVPDEVKDAWCDIVERLWARTLIPKDGRIVSQIAHFTPKGKQAWIEFFDAHADEMNSYGFEDLRSPWGKLREYAGRLCLVLGCLRHAADPTADLQAVPRITAEGVRATCRLVGYFKSHSHRVRAVLSHGRAMWGGVVGKVVYDWVRQHGLASFSERDVKQARRSVDPADLAEALAALEKSHVIRRRETSIARPRGGRPPLPIFDVNPAIHVTRNPQNAQNHHAA